MRYLVLAYLFISANPSQAADEVAITSLEMASRLDMPKFAMPVRVAGCAQGLEKYGREISDPIQLIRRSEIESDMMSNPSLDAKPLANLKGQIVSTYLKPMSQALNGRRLAMSQIPDSVRTFSSFTHYIGNDVWDNPVALLRIGRVITKDLGVVAPVPGTRMIFPEWQTHDYWILDDVLIGLDFRTKKCVNELALFNLFVDRVIRNNPNQANIDRIIAFSDDASRSERLMKLGFVERVWPTRGTIHLERGETVEEIDFTKQPAQGGKIFEYEVSR